MPSAPRFFRRALVALPLCLAAGWWGMRAPVPPSEPVSVTAGPGAVAADAPPAVPGEPDAASLAAPFLDTATPLAEREAAVDALARRADPAALRQLLALAESRAYLSARALEALGTIGTPEAVAHLRLRVAQHDDLRVRELAAATRALAAAAGPQAGDAVASLLAAVRRRHDGGEEDLIGTCIEALAGIGGAAAEQALSNDLTSLADEGAGPLAGADTVAALRRIGGRAAVPVLVAYADRLPDLLPAAIAAHERRMAGASWSAERIAAGTERLRQTYAAHATAARQAARELDRTSIGSQSSPASGQEL